MLERIGNLTAELEEERERVSKRTFNEERKLKFTDCINALQNDSVSVSDKNQFLKAIVKEIRMDVTDLGRRKGYNIVLNVYL